MKTITREEVIRNTITEYKAVDGTVFKDRDECLKYERTCQGVISGRFMRAFGVTAETAEFTAEDTMFSRLSCDDRLFSITPKNQTQLDILSMYESKGEARSAWNPEDIGKTLYFDAYDGYLYFLGTREDLIKELNDTLDDIDKASRKEVE